MKSASDAIAECEDLVPPQMKGAFGDFVEHCFWKAFHAGGCVNVAVGLAGGEMRPIRPAAHAVDRATGRCLGVMGP
jgi:hypothetical protein